MVFLSDKAETTSVAVQEKHGAIRDGLKRALLSQATGLAEDHNPLDSGAILGYIILPLVFKTLIEKEDLSPSGLFPGLSSRF